MIIEISVLCLWIFNSEIVSGCSSDLDCSLNGLCVDPKSDRPIKDFDGKNGNVQSRYQSRESTVLPSSFSSSSLTTKQCRCDKPWSGENCETLRFLPVEGSPSSKTNGAKDGHAEDASSAAAIIAAQGYGMVPNITTWGGGILTETIERPTDSKIAGNSTSTSTLYHLYVSRMTNDCPLQFFKSNSRIDHAVSDSITGPYEFFDVAVPVFSHNPAPIELWSREEKTTSKTDDEVDSNDEPSWKYALFHIGNGIPPTDGEKDCRDGYGYGGSSSSSSGTFHDMTSSSSQRRKQRRHLLVQDDIGSNGEEGSDGAHVGGSTIHVSESLYGPWVPLLDHDLGHCNNPSPWVHPANGTLFVVCSNGGHRVRLLKSEHGDVSGPYELVTEFFTNTTAGRGVGPAPSATAEATVVLPRGVAYEDPFLYTDSRGNFHCIFHAYQHTGSSRACEDTLVSAHAYSRDGYEWHTAPVSPYGSRIDVAVPVPGTGVTVAGVLDEGARAMSTGSKATAVEKITLATRERPKLVFGEDGRMTHLVQGVCGSPACEDTPYGPFCCECKYRQWDFTLVSALDVS